MTGAVKQKQQKKKKEHTEVPKGRSNERRPLFFSSPSNRIKSMRLSVSFSLFFARQQSGAKKSDNNGHRENNRGSREDRGPRRDRDRRNGEQSSSSTRRDRAPAASSSNQKGKHTRFDEAPAPAGQQASRNASVSAAPTTSAWEKQARQQRREGGDRQQGSAPAGAVTGRGGATAPATPAAATPSSAPKRTMADILRGSTSAISVPPKRLLCF